jgi:hypothetical protein
MTAPRWGDEARSATTATADYATPDTCQPAKETVNPPRPARYKECSNGQQQHFCFNLIYQRFNWTLGYSPTGTVALPVDLADRATVVG